MTLKPMYPPQKDSPSSFLLGDISAVDVLITVASAASLPQTTPYPLTLGIDKTLTETVMVTAMNLGNNQLTVTRGTPAYAWPAGSKVARVLTAKDFKDLQDNVTDINTDLTVAQDTLGTQGTKISELQVKVGSEQSGLIKDLAYEIIRAKAAEGYEATRATTAEGALETAKVNRTELAQVITDWVYSADGTKVLVTITRYNASTQQISQYTRTLPVASAEAMGVMTPEAYAEITALRNDVNTLINLGGRFIGVSFATKAALNAYVVPSSVKTGDFTYVLDDETKSGSTTRYVRNGSTWDFTFVIDYDPVGLADTVIPGIVKSTSGMSWVGRTSAVNNIWTSVCYGDGMFVAVASSGTGNRVMSSPDGINWTARTSASDKTWTSVCYGNGMFVAVNKDGDTSCIMTSPNGITWTIRTGFEMNLWQSVCYGNGLFVAVSKEGTDPFKLVMTSPDGITWTYRVGSYFAYWESVCYGDGLFVAVSSNVNNGPGYGVMTSTDGINWSDRDAIDNNWRSVCYGNGLFVAVAASGTGNRVMSSPDGINWTARTSASDKNWVSVCYGNGLFVAVSSDGFCMISPDGVNWNIKTTAVSNAWQSVCYGNGLFVAVSDTGTGNRVMTAKNINGKIFVESDGTMSVIGWDSVVMDDDERLYNARIPSVHKTSHSTNGFDPLSIEDIGAAAAIHKNNHATEGSDPLSPEDIGAAADSHSQSASTISEGTLAGQVNANAAAIATLGTAQVRDIMVGTGDLIAGVTALGTGYIYLMYE